MITLAVDTATPTATAALVEDGRLLAEWILCKGLTHSERLLPMIERLLDQSGIALPQVGLYAAVVGPGSFTGVRIGVSTVRALCHVHAKPVAAVDTLTALAYNLPFADRPVVPLLDARRDQVYAAAYRWRGEAPERLIDMRVQKLDEFIHALKAFGQEFIFLGDGCAPNEAALTEAFPKSVFAPGAQRYPRASSAAQAGLALLSRGGAVSYEALMPLYLRASQAERELEARLAVERELEAKLAAEGGV